VIGNCRSFAGGAQQSFFMRIFSTHKKNLTCKCAAMCDSPNAPFFQTGRKNVWWRKNLNF
jgi:hypothetical protein